MPKDLNNTAHHTSAQLFPSRNDRSIPTNDALQALGLLQKVDGDPLYDQVVRHETAFLKAAIHFLENDDFLSTQLGGRGLEQAVTLAEEIKKQMADITFKNRVKGKLPEIAANLGYNYQQSGKMLELAPPPTISADQYLENRAIIRPSDYYSRQGFYRNIIGEAGETAAIQDYYATRAGTNAAGVQLRQFGVAPMAPVAGVTYGPLTAAERAGFYRGAGRLG